MYTPYYLAPLANEIRDRVKAQDWRVFLQFDGMGTINDIFKVEDGALFVATNSNVAIRCADGAMIKADNPSAGELAADLWVVSFYASAWVADTEMVPAQMLALWYSR